MEWKPISHPKKPQYLAIVAAAMTLLTGCEPDLEGVAPMPLDGDVAVSIEPQQMGTTETTTETTVDVMPMETEAVVTLSGDVAVCTDENNETTTFSMN